MDNTTVLPKDMWDKIVASLPPPPPKLLQAFFIKFTLDRGRYAEIYPSRAVSLEELALIKWFEDYDPEKKGYGRYISSATTLPGEQYHRSHFADRFLKDAVMLGYDFMSPADRLTYTEKINKDDFGNFFMIKRPS